MKTGSVIPAIARREEKRRKEKRREEKKREEKRRKEKRACGDSSLQMST
jgi:hypothetical protein